MPIDEQRKGLVKQWLEKAEGDFSLANYLLEEDTQFYFSIGFHAKQAMEEYLVALLEFHEVDALKSRHIGPLLDHVQPIDGGLAEKLSWMRSFVKLAGDSADAPELTKEEAEKVYALAGHTRDVIMGQLGYLTE
jgi:HEPN domain-containing protein